jgi:hypothetical protein
MNVRLIKRGMSRPDKNPKQLPPEVPIIETIQSWVRDFQSIRSDRALLDFKRIRNLGKI